MAMASPLSAAAAAADSNPCHSHDKEEDDSEQGRSRCFIRAAADHGHGAPPPHVSLSLRTRQSCALSLKHIFDHIISSSAAPSPSPSSALTANSSSAAAAKDEENATNNSLIQQYFRNAVSAGMMNGGVHEHHSNNYAAMQRGPENRPITRAPALPFPSPSAAARPQIGSSPAMTAEEQPTSQLTIFYSGSVIVYDDFPADKAKAMMVLLEAVDEASLMSTNGNKMDGENAIEKEGLVKEWSVANDCTNLPQARKASLVRFLEKRKDRIPRRQNPSPKCANAPYACCCMEKEDLNNISEHLPSPKRFQFQ